MRRCRPFWRQPRSCSACCRMVRSYACLAPGIWVCWSCRSALRSVWPAGSALRRGHSPGLAAARRPERREETPVYDDYDPSPFARAFIGSDRVEFRTRVLFDHGASLTVAREVLTYTEPAFAQTQVELPGPGGRADEAHVATWRGYAALASRIGVWETLRERLVQLQFPVQVGMSQHPDY